MLEYKQKKLIKRQVREKNEVIIDPIVDMKNTATYAPKIGKHVA